MKLKKQVLPGVYFTNKSATPLTDRIAARRGELCSYCGKPKHIAFTRIW